MGQLQQDKVKLSDRLLYGVWLPLAGVKLKNSFLSVRSY